MASAFAVMQDKAAVFFVRAFVEVVDPFGVERGRTAFDTVHFIALFQKQLGKIGAVLSSHAGDQCFFHVLSQSAAVLAAGLIVPVK